MHAIADFLNEKLDIDLMRFRRTSTHRRPLGVRRATSFVGLSVREFAVILELLGIDRFHDAVWTGHTNSQTTKRPPMAAPF